MLRVRSPASSESAHPSRGRQLLQGQRGKIEGRASLYTYALHATSSIKHAVGTRNNPNQKYAELRTIVACKKHKTQPIIGFPSNRRVWFNQCRASCSTEAPGSIKSIERSQRQMNRLPSGSTGSHLPSLSVGPCPCFGTSSSLLSRMLF